MVKLYGIAISGIFPYTTFMYYLTTFLIFGLCIFGMAIGLIFAKKALKKGCSIDPDACECLKEGKDPSRCEK
jgi:hypothetical protein